MPHNETAIIQFQDILLHNLGLHERHSIKNDTFESEEINDLYRAFQAYRHSPTNENLSTLTSTLKVCKSFDKDLPYQQLNNLIEQMGGSKTRRNFTR